MVNDAINKNKTEPKYLKPCEVEHGMGCVASEGFSVRISPTVGLVAAATATEAKKLHHRNAQSACLRLSMGISPK